MNWKLPLLKVYYETTLPWRRRRNRQAAAAGRAPLVVLLYHRIVDDRANLWTTNTKAFREQINWLKGEFEFISLAEVQRRLRAAENRTPAVHITFDDGYAVNCEMALPLLIAERIPVTYFVTADSILKGGYFAHDTAMGHRFEPNSLEELQALAAAGVEIGHHTRTHADMGQLKDRARIYDELVTSRNELQAALGHPIRYFAFPYGQHHRLSSAAFQVAYHNGYDGVCSSYGGYNFPGDDPFHIQRIPADDYTLRLKNWAMVDPVKVRRTHRFFYGGVGRAPELETAVS